MIPVFHAVLAAILGSGGSAAPAHQSRIPVITYGANALVQGGGAVQESTNKPPKATLKEDLKTTHKVVKTTDKELKTTDKLIKGELKYNKTVKDVKIIPEHKEAINK